MDGGINWAIIVAAAAATAVYVKNYITILIPHPGLAPCPTFGVYTNLLYLLLPAHSMYVYSKVKEANPTG